MQRWSLQIVICLAAWAAGIAGFAQPTVVVSSPPLAGDCGISARHHPWGRFKPGAWKLVRVVTETLDDHGQVVATNISETKTSLVEVGRDGVVLEVEVGIDVAGKQFSTQPRCIKQGFNGDPAELDIKCQPPAEGQVTIGDKRIACRSQQLEITETNRRTLTNLYYSDNVAPYVLKRESTTIDPATKGVLSEVEQEVVALDMPHRVLAEIKPTACVKSLQKNDAGSISSLSMTTPDVPGGVVYQSSKEMDKAGHLVRRSTLELINYGTKPEEERIGLFGRKRPPRRVKQGALRGD